MSTSQTSQLATTIVSFLAPFLPYLLKGVEEGAKEAGKKLGDLGGEMALEKAQVLFERIRRRFKDDEEIKSAVTLVGKQPESETRQATLGEVLAERLASDPALRQELTALIAGLPAQDFRGVLVSGSGAVATHGGVAAGAGGIAVGGDVSGRIDTGNEVSSEA